MGPLRRAKTGLVAGVGACALVAAACSVAACGQSPASSRAPRASSPAQAIGAASNAVAPLTPARLVPESAADKPTFGLEPGGGTRSIVAGLRVIAIKGGALRVSEQRFTAMPSSVATLPPHLGSGFLFVVGATVWRSDEWLSTATPIFTSAQAILQVLPGLDRVYVKTPNTYVAIDGRSGKVLDLGPWPRTSFVASYAASGSWRAAAITDLRGVVVTSDAGATWRSIDVPFEPRQVVASGPNLLLGDGVDWYEIRSDLGLSKTSVAPLEASRVVVTKPKKAPDADATGSAPPPPRASTDDEDESTRVLGKRPLVAAIEDGAPLGDGTAVVFRDGAIALVRLADGAVTFLARDAFPMESARCHALSLATRPDRPEVGFVCGEPSGKTAIYAYEPARRAARLLRQFDRPRTVTGGGNGTLAVRGSCSSGAEPGPAPHDAPAVVPVDEPSKRPEKIDVDGAMRKAPDAGAGHEPSPLASASKPPDARPIVAQPFCVMGPDRAFREVVVRSDTSAVRVVALANGSLAVLSPPVAADGPARLTLLADGRGKTVPVTFPKPAADVARVLRLGVWLDGFEERRPGVLGGWIEAGGVMLGVEVSLDGRATPGQLVRDAGLPFVSGRYGFGFSGARRGYETIDGGMTWTSLELPEPLTPLAKVDKRAAGPVGALAAGWLRVGWGEAPPEPGPTIPPVYRASGTFTAPALDLSCEPMEPAPPPIPTSKPRAARSAIAQPRPPVLGSGGVLAPAVVPGVSELPPFYREAAPVLQEAERGMPIEVQELPDRSLRIGPMARIYAWGPRTGEWDTQGKWLVRWLSPFEGYGRVHSSLAVLPPSPIVDLSRFNPGYGYSSPAYGFGSSGWQLYPGDDASHALLVQRHGSPVSLSLYELSADREPMLVRRADGEPFVELEGAVRAFGSWVVATPTPASGAHPVTVLWQIDSGVAHELTRIPRLLPDTGRPAGSRLARHDGGNSVGLILDGQSTPERAVATRWVLPVDLRTGQKGEPTSLGYADLAGDSLAPCSSDGSGFVFDTTLPSATVKVDLPRGRGSLHGLYARVRVGSSGACALAVSGLFDGQTPEREALLVGAKPTAHREASGDAIMVTALSMQTRHALRCRPKEEGKPRAASVDGPPPSRNAR